MTPGVPKRASRDLRAADATAASAPWYPGFRRQCILRRRRAFHTAGTCPGLRTVVFAELLAGTRNLAASRCPEWAEARADRVDCEMVWPARLAGYSTPAMTSTCVSRGRGGYACSRGSRYSVADCFSRAASLAVPDWRQGRRPVQVSGNRLPFKSGSRSPRGIASTGCECVRPILGRRTLSDRIRGIRAFGLRMVQSQEAGNPGVLGQAHDSRGQRQHSASSRNSKSISKPNSTSGLMRPIRSRYESLGSSARAGFHGLSLRSSKHGHSSVRFPLGIDEGEAPS